MPSPGYLVQVQLRDLRDRLSIKPTSDLTILLPELSEPLSRLWCRFPRAILLVLTKGHRTVIPRRSSPEKSLSRFLMRLDLMRGQTNFFLL